MDDRDIIDRRRTEYVEAFNREDIAAMMGYATDDVDGMARRSEPVARTADGHAWLKLFNA